MTHHLNGVSNGKCTATKNSDVEYVFEFKSVVIMSMLTKSMRGFIHRRYTSVLLIMPVRAVLLW